jgi:hypothetical protein
MNGKSCNINNAARQIYPERGPQHPIPLEEVLCVFDADQVGGRGWKWWACSWCCGWHLHQGSSFFVHTHLPCLHC